jgi:tetratricopeptide (TPR) repeat protein
MTGASDGWQKLSARSVLNSDDAVVQLIASEILLLREARLYGPTSYFAYRMGVLASLTANIMLPYGFAWTPEDVELRRAIIADIEKNLNKYDFAVPQKSRAFIRSATDYFEQRRSFFNEDKRLIAHDYKTGINYDGIMKQGGRAYFIRAIETVADVWNTVLRADTVSKEFDLSKPSDRTLTWYFLDEMEFLINSKSNMVQVEKVYSNFEKVNPDIADAYDQLGDIFYANVNEDVKLRGVAEWQKAYELGGPGRSRIGQKLSSHYLQEGGRFMELASKPGAEDTDLNNALNAFERALHYDRTSQQAAELIQATHVAIRDRGERLEVTLNIIATGERIHEEANRYREGGDFANAISTYRQSIGFFEAIDDEFREQANTAREKIRRLRREITDVINEVLDAASQEIDNGDRAREQKQYDTALGHYNRVASVVAVIPEDESPTILQDKQDVIALAARKIEEANVERLRYEQAQMEQQAAQTQAQPSNP